MALDEIIETKQRPATRQAKPELVEADYMGVQSEMSKQESYVDLKSPTVWSDDAQGLQTEDLDPLFHNERIQPIKQKWRKVTFQNLLLMFIQFRWVALVIWTFLIVA